MANPHKTGMESVEDRPEVKEYLAEHGLRIQSQMPGWPGWDKPHLMTNDGGILPTSPQRLMQDVQRWQETGNAWHVMLAEGEFASC